MPWVHSRCPRKIDSINTSRQIHILVTWECQHADEQEYVSVFVFAQAIFDDNVDIDHFDSTNRWTGTSPQRHIIISSILIKITFKESHKFLLMSKMFSKAKTVFRWQLQFPVRAIGD